MEDTALPTEKAGIGMSAARDVSDEFRQLTASLRRYVLLNPDGKSDCMYRVFALSCSFPLLISCETNNSEAVSNDC